MCWQRVNYLDLKSKPQGSFFLRSCCKPQQSFEACEACEAELMESAINRLNIRSLKRIIIHQRLLRSRQASIASTYYSM